MSKLISNSSGVIPTKGRIVVLIDDRSELKKIKESTSLILDAMTNKVAGSDTTEMLGKIVAIGDDCFDEWSVVPEVGATILFDRYAGKIFVGADESIYRMMSFSCVAGIISHGVDKISPYELRGV